MGPNYYYVIFHSAKCGFTIAHILEMITQGHWWIQVFYNRDVESQVTLFHPPLSLSITSSHSFLPFP